MTRVGVPAHVAISNLLQEYSEKLRQKREAEAAAAAREAEEEKELDKEGVLISIATEADADGDTPPESAADDPSDALALSVAEEGGGSACCAEDCKRRCTAHCAHKMCFECCYQQRKRTDVERVYCEVHHLKIQKREREEKYLEEAISSTMNRKPQRLPLLAEERFTAVGQTVVQWCLRDFLVNRRWSEDSLAVLRRGQRQKELSKKRQKLTSDK